MGEARLKGRHGINGLNGHTRHRDAAPEAPGMAAQVQVRLVPNIKVQNTADAVLLMLGTDLPEVGAQMTPADARRLGTALLQHADDLDKATPRIIVPGANLRLPPPPQESAS